MRLVPVLQRLTIRVSNEAANDGADDEPQRARRSTEAKMWRCSALDQLDEPLSVLPARQLRT